MNETHKDRQCNARASNGARDFFVAKVGCPLKAWMHYIDQNLNNRVDFDEFCNGMRALQFEGDVVRLWKEIDEDGYDELTLDEIDQECATLWISFRQWCSQRFESSIDMVCRVGDGTGISEQQFCHRIPLLGWDGGEEERLFGGLCVGHDGLISTTRLRWLDVDKRRQRRKEAAKLKAATRNQSRMKEKLAGVKALKDFKKFLVEHHGSLFHAWRKVLDVDGSMSVQKKELFKAAREGGWGGNVRALWKQLDQDDSSVAGLEELDAASAHQLAQFKAWAVRNSGSVAAAFKALDKKDFGKLKIGEFASASAKMCFPGGKAAARSLFHLLDWENKHRLTVEDVIILDEWHPPRYLTTVANAEAAEDFKKLLLKKHRHSLKAWRQVLDRDGSNRVSWVEFEEAARRIAFKGDTAGAWLSLDSDLSGFITLREISPETVNILLAWKDWADSEMGSVRSAFKMMDADSSGSLTKQEFRRACQDFGFTGNCKSLFHELDCSRGGTISLNEVVFLDEWHMDDDNNFEDDTGGTSQHLQSIATTAVSTMSTVAPSIPDVAAVSIWYSLIRKAKMAPMSAVTPPPVANKEAFSALMPPSRSVPAKTNKAWNSCTQSRLLGFSDKLASRFTQLSSPYAKLPAKNRSNTCYKI